MARALLSLLQKRLRLPNERPRPLLLRAVLSSNRVHGNSRLMMTKAPTFDWAHPSNNMTCGRRAWTHQSFAVSRGYASRIIIILYLFYFFYFFRFQEEKKRQEALFELILTEQIYVKKLALIVEVPLFSFFLLYSFHSRNFVNTISCFTTRCAHDSQFRSINLSSPTSLSC